MTSLDTISTSRSHASIWMMRTYLVAALFAVAITSFGANSTLFAEVGNTQVDPQQYEKTVTKAIEFLRKSQLEDGSFHKQMGVPVTAIVTTGLLESGRTSSDPMVAKALKFLTGYVQKDGGIYTPKMLYRNYETCVSMVCFQAANQDGKYDNIIKDAENFVKEIQWDGKEGHDVSSTSFGGAGYGKHRRPDLSNTQFMIEALHTVGTKSDDKALQNALIFISRCQNLETGHNTTPFAAKINDGGFYYTPAAGGSSQAGTTPDGGLRSYGSMTYAGLKSMIFAGVEKDDPRVKAAFAWLEKHYSLEENPGMGDSGLYYYYHTLAKTLDVMNVETIKDANGLTHYWKPELVNKLAENQLPSGAWINGNARWLEGESNLVTGYVLLALSHCKPEVKAETAAK